MDEEKNSLSKDTNFLAPACGLFCGVCSDYDNNECHGCGCECGCAGKWHIEHCSIAKCAKSQNLESCAGCDDLPCTELIQFTNHPIWTTHSVCIENLRRRKKIGTKKWIEEQEKYWENEKNRAVEIWHHDECGKKAREFNKSRK